MHMQASIILECIKEATDNAIRQQQAGLRRGRSCCEQIFTLKQTIEKAAGTDAADTKLYWLQESLWQRTPSIGMEYPQGPRDPKKDHQNNTEILWWQQEWSTNRGTAGRLAPNCHQSDRAVCCHHYCSFGSRTGSWKGQLITASMELLSTGKHDWQTWISQMP